MTKASTGKRVKAYVLIETAAGKAKVVKKSLSRIKSGPSTMVHLDGITGPFDFIAIVEGPNLDAVGRLVTDGIGAIDGVTRTTTCIAVSIG
ncbi:MAG: AsnC family transcriptional regulator [Candidatus Rokuibacteriota bacterium]|nr:MAG: AsnC family transcriptional regulator [Candidatus Rokubacteria bacterium]